LQDADPSFGLLAAGDAPSGPPDAGSAPSEAGGRPSDQAAAGGVRSSVCQSEKDLDFLAELEDMREDLESLGDHIAELSARIEVATYHLLALIREFDRRRGWAACGHASCAQWLNWRTGMDLGTAREKIRVARALGDLPAISRLMCHGELSYSKVRALTRVADASASCPSRRRCARCSASCV
jgi:hypothetical protein